MVRLHYWRAEGENYKQIVNTNKIFLSVLIGLRKGRITGLVLVEYVKKNTISEYDLDVLVWFGFMAYQRL